MVTRRHWRIALAFVAVSLSLACGEYAHSNPYDPDTDTQITIAGPDTIWSIGELAEFTATVSPPVSGGRGIVWDAIGNADGFVVLTPGIGIGKFRAAHVGAASVSATVGRHVASKRVVVRQRPARVELFCPDLCTALTMTAIGSTRELLVGQYDALGTGLHFTQARADVTYASREPGIVGIVPGTGSPTGVTIRAVATGTTYVTAQLGSWIDSVRVTVTAP